MKKGIDISYFQGNVDFNKVKADGIDFIIPRDGYGKSTKDSKFSQYVADAIKAGIEVPGIYHFSYALSEDDARNDARQAVKYAQIAAYRHTLGCALAVEGMGAPCNVLRRAE